MPEVPRKPLRVAEGALGDASAFLRLESVDDDRAVVGSMLGALDIAASPVVARQVLGLLALPIRSLTLDLSGVTFMDSAGLGVLNVARIHASNNDVRLILSDVPPFVESVLEIAGMRELFELL